MTAAPALFDRAIVVGAPLEGWVVPLDEVPDPVFAGRMLGDGLAIDPVGDTLVAPFDGVLISVHAARHALTFRSSDGVELLVHLGIDSVALGGAGIEILAAEGATVRAGQPLLRFDLDRLVLGARAAVTPVIVANPSEFTVEPLARGLVAPGDALFRVVRRELAATAPQASGEVLRRSVRVALAHGIHARPAARLSAAVKRFAVDAAIVHGERRAPVSSALALLQLDVSNGAAVTLEASGADAAAALDALEKVLLDAGPENAPVPVPLAASGDGQGLRGVPAAPGLGIGRAFRLYAADAAADGPVGDVESETAKFSFALVATRFALAAGAAQPGAAGEVLAAQLAFLDDQALLQETRRAIDQGRGAVAAWRAAIKAQVEVLAAAKDPRIAERVVDLRDLELRLLAALTGEPRVSLDIPEGSILLAHDLLPSQVAALDPAKVAGIALAEGGPTSHAAILAAGSGIPMAVAFGTALDTIGEGVMLQLDADQGALEVDPPAARIAEAEAAMHEREAAAKAMPTGACRAADGERIEIFANLGSLADAEAAVAAGAEGCGLLRTEFLFLDRSEPPGEEEQRCAYQSIADALGDRPLIVRLLDIGGDKPAPYLSIPPEENPVLGLRGIRVGLARPEVLETQLRAILSVQPPGRCRIMPPMIASLAELEAVADAVERIEREIGLDPATKVGAMIETPAAALTSDILSSRAAFLSIGTNDLAQYALAMDRGNAAVAAEIDGLHPAVLRLIAAACEGAGTHGVPVGVCGGLAADRLAVPVLLGLGVTELSVPPARVAATKAQVAGLSIARCRILAAEALGLESAAAVRARAAMFLEGEQQ